MLARDHVPVALQLHAEFEEEAGLEVLLFPCNQLLQQMPGAPVVRCVHASAALSTPLTAGLLFQPCRAGEAPLTPAAAVSTEELCNYMSAQQFTLPFFEAVWARPRASSGTG